MTVNVILHFEAVNVIYGLHGVHGVHGGNEGHKYSRPITLSKHSYIANARCDFSFITVSNCVTFLKIHMHIGDRIRYFCNRKIGAIQTKYNS